MYFKRISIIIIITVRRWRTRIYSAPITIKVIGALQSQPYRQRTQKAKLKSEPRVVF